MDHREAKQALGRTPRAGDALYNEAGQCIWESNAKPKCHRCHQTAEVVMEIGACVDDWVFVECGSCDRPVCGKCWEHFENEAECFDCYGMRVA